MNIHNKFTQFAAFASILAVIVVHSHEVLAEEEQSSRAPQERNYSPYPKQDFPDKVLFGDTHLHTIYSFDAGMFGNVLGPDQAYRFAKGEKVISTSGQAVSLQRPLDFLVVTDHAENLGVAPMIAQADPLMKSIPFGSQLIEKVQAGDLAGAWNDLSVQKSDGKDPFADNPEIYSNAWNVIIDAAKQHNKPGMFTALIGFEWSSTYQRSNLHRNVIFRGGKETAATIIPYSQYDSADPEDLWAWMAKYEADTGDRLLAIPHNGNLSNGLMFDDTKLGVDTPIDSAYAKNRARWEPVYEVTQYKGDGETHPTLSPDDEFADFETWDKGQLGPAPKELDMIPREYAREALKKGLVYHSSLGENPFKFGMIGSTDSHTSLSTTTEDNFFGKFVGSEPGTDPARMFVVIGGVGGPKKAHQYTWQTGAAGLAAVWSRENTREAIWDALARREVYATTGTRIQVRVFAGYGFEKKDLSRSNFAEYGYAQGVPMGADLPAPAEGQNPGFLIKAMSDPDGAKLDRIQIIKGWTDNGGRSMEAVYDVAWSGDRQPDQSGKLPAVGSTVDQATASYSNTIGEAILEAYWQDSDFDPGQHAFYYIRVLEIPTPRWTTFDASFYGVDIPPEAPVSIQDRAYTSPIWYTPAKKQHQ